jgi:hypothetical protein
VTYNGGVEPPGRSNVDDWGDIDGDETRAPGPRSQRRSGAGRGHGGLGREQRYVITLAVIAALMLVAGIGIGFAFGRLTAPTPTPEPVVASESLEPSAGVEPVETTQTASFEESEALAAETSETPSAEENRAPDTPKQVSPDDGDRIDASRTKLRWSEVTDPDGDEVTYAFEIETYASGEWGDHQEIDGIKTTSYPARVLSNRRRWRVWAVDSNGNAGEKSDWSIYRHTAVSTPTSSNTSSSTAQ